MPTIGDVAQFLGSQLFGKTTLPTTDLSGKTMIVTGANTGLGLECAKHLTRLNLSTLILACRNAKKGEAAKASIFEETGRKNRMTIEVWEVDLDSHSSVISFINRINSELPRLDGFVCNAGVGLKTFEVSENLERSLTINVISTFLVGIGVLPKLKETSALHATETNLTIVGSMIHIFGLDAQLQLPEGMKIFDALSDSKTADMNGRYPLSKLIVHQCFNELAERASSSASDKGHRVVINIVNPAWCKTELFQYKAEPLPQKKGVEPWFMV